MTRQVLDTTQTHQGCRNDVLSEAGQFVFDRGAAYWRRFYFYAYFYACVPGWSHHARSVTPD